MTTVTGGDIASGDVGEMRPYRTEQAWIWFEANMQNARKSSASQSLFPPLIFRPDLPVFQLAMCPDSTEPEKSPQEEAEAAKAEESQVDESLEESFPASDPPSWTRGREHSTD